MTNGEKSFNKSFNPVEKNLQIYMYDCPAEYLERKNTSYIQEVMESSIGLSKANIEGKFVRLFNPHGASGVYSLSESDAAFHITPETDPNFISFRISTCGNSTHPILAVKFILEKLNPAAGKICYYKEGYDIANRTSVFPKTLFNLIKKYHDQFDENK